MNDWLSNPFIMVGAGVITGLGALAVLGARSFAKFKRMIAHQEKSVEHPHGGHFVERTINDPNIRARLQSDIATALAERLDRQMLAGAMTEPPPVSSTIDPRMHVRLERLNAGLDLSAEQLQALATAAVNAKGGDGPLGPFLKDLCERHGCTFDKCLRIDKYLNPDTGEYDREVAFTIEENPNSEIVLRLPAHKIAKPEPWQPPAEKLRVVRLNRKEKA